MELELLNYINMDLNWTIIKKGRTNTSRCPKKSWANSFESGHKIHESTAVERNKVVNAAPLKKQKLLHQSTSPCINGEDSGQRCWSNLVSMSQKAKPKSRLRKCKILKQINKDGQHVVDFSGIELLATVACSSFINDNPTLPEVNSCTVDVQDFESNVSLIQQNLQANGKEIEEKKVVVSKELRLHWDLNTVMDEWDEPCDDLQIELVKRDAANSHVPLVENCKNGSVDETHELIEDLEVMNTRKIDSASKLCEDFSKSILIEKVNQDRVSECCGSNVTQEELEVGYDSPFEDGELRELVVKTENGCDKMYNDDLGTTENSLFEKVDHGQTTGGQTSLLVKVDVPKEEIKKVVQVDTFERLHFDESRNRSSISGDYPTRYCDLKSYRSLETNYSKNYNPTGGGYRTRDRRPSSSERNNGYDRYTFHSQEYHHHHPKQYYLDRTPRFSTNFNRHGTRSISRPRSRSGSPIAWHFPKRKNLDSSNSIRVSPERSAKCFDDNKQSLTRIKQQFDSIRDRERLKSDDYFRFAKCPARFSQMNEYKHKDRY